MPWISQANYTQLIRENERARVSLEDLKRLRAQVLKLSEDLESERARNRDREDILVDRVVVSKGAYAVTQREKKPKPSPSSLPLTALEEAELKMYVESAQDQGFGPEVGKRYFERDRKKRLDPEADLSAFNDLPVITPLQEIVDEVQDLKEVTEAAG